MVGKLKMHRLLICKNLSGAWNGSQENRVLTLPLAVLCLLLLMPSSGAKPLSCWQTAYFSQLWTRFSLEPFWAPLRFLHISNQGNFTFPIMLYSTIFEYVKILGTLLMWICCHFLRILFVSIFILLYKCAVYSFYKYFEAFLHL